ncbi:hypothetical protein L1887_23327 [Cichorium endivia]|nr:hypothetical protein L1887_23327 [Cichorium endivia]
MASTRTLRTWKIRVMILNFQDGVSSTFMEVNRCKKETSDFFSSQCNLPNVSEDMKMDRKLDEVLCEEECALKCEMGQEALALFFQTSKMHLFIMIMQGPNDACGCPYACMLYISVLSKVMRALETTVSALTPIAHAKLHANEVQPAFDEH